MKYALFIILIVAGLSSCTTSTLTRGTNYPNMYKENPATLLIMPPINKTTHVEAKEYFYTSLALPLCNKGFYVVSPFLAMEMFKGESAYESEMFINGSLEQFRNVFGADAVLFTTVNAWTKSALVGTITVDVEYELKSTKNNESLFKRRGKLTIDNNDTNSTGSGLEMLVGTIATAVTTALTDKVVAARSCNNFVLYDLPSGKYSPESGKDQDFEACEANITTVVKQ